MTQESQYFISNDNIPGLDGQSKIVRIEEEQDGILKISRVIQRKLRDELNHHSFSARNDYGETKFRNETFFKPNTKIIDGREVAIHAFLWIVSFRYNGNHFCGGSLINEATVLTAAHCLDFEEDANIEDQLRV